MSGRASIPKEPPEGIGAELWERLNTIAGGSVLLSQVLIEPHEARMILASIVKAKTKDVLGGE